MRSDLMKKGLERAPHRSLLKAMGYTDEEIARPLIGCNSAKGFSPGHVLLNTIAEDSSRTSGPWDTEPVPPSAYVRNCHGHTGIISHSSRN